jgi:hypothetical protein
VALAKHLDLSSKRIQQLAEEEVLPRLPDGSFDRDVCRVIYIRYLRSEGRRVTTSAAGSRAQNARAQEIELRIARDLGKLVEIDEVEAVFGDILAAYRAELAGVPASCTRDLELRAIVEDKINAAVERCRQRFEQASTALRGGGDVLVDAEGPDA